MAGSAPADGIEELTLCSCCRRAFDGGERAPKLLACKHHFCLSCARTVLGAGRDVRCVHCWKRTELPAGRADRLPTHAPVLALARRLAPAPAPAPPPRPASPDDLRLAVELHRLTARRRDFLLRALDAATALKVRLEAELARPPEPCAGLRARHRLLLLQCRLDDAVRHAGDAGALDGERVRRALAGAPPPPAGAEEAREPLLFLANFCLAQVYAGGGSPARSSSAASGSPVGGSPARAPSPYPLYYLSVSVDGAPAGRVVVEVRADVAPRMAHNFERLCGGGGAGGGTGPTYRGCSVFQCWEGESVIAGDVPEAGRGGFVPDETRLAAARGAVGMRRSQRRHDTLGLVGSQFRIVLREMRGFTAIFGCVAEGLPLVDRLSRTGDSAGKPQANILITDCGRLN